MKVVCIDNSIKNVNNKWAIILLKKLVEGDIYIVEFSTKDSYKLKGIEKPLGCPSITPPTFLKNRFIPLSNINENELSESVVKEHYNSII